VYYAYRGTQKESRLVATTVQCYRLADFAPPVPFRGSKQTLERTVRSLCLGQVARHRDNEIEFAFAKEIDGLGLRLRYICI